MPAAIPAAPGGVSKSSMWKRLVRSERARKAGGGNGANPMDLIVSSGIAAGMGFAFAKMPQFAMLGGQLDTRLAIVGAGLGWRFVLKKRPPKIMQQATIAAGTTWAYEQGARAAVGG